MFNTFVSIFKNKELRNGIIFAVIVIVVCRILAELLID